MSSIVCICYLCVCDAVCHFTLSLVTTNSLIYAFIAPVLQIDRCRTLFLLKARTLIYLITVFNTVGLYSLKWNSWFSFGLISVLSVMAKHLAHKPCLKILINDVCSWPKQHSCSHAEEEDTSESCCEGKNGAYHLAWHVRDTSRRLLWMLIRAVLMCQHVTPWQQSNYWYRLYFTVRGGPSFRYYLSKWLDLSLYQPSYSSACDSTAPLSHAVSEKKYAAQLCFCVIRRRK